MHCAGCVGKVERALLATPGVVRASVSLASADALIAYRSDQTGPAALSSAIQSVGFEALEQHDQASQDQQQQAEQAELIRLRKEVAELRRN